MYPKYFFITIHSFLPIFLVFGLWKDWFIEKLVCAKKIFFLWNILNHGLSWLFPVMSIILFLCTMYFHPNYFSYWSFSFQLHSLQTSLEAFESWLCFFLVSVTTLNILFYLWTRLLLICLKEKILPPFLVNIMARATAIAGWKLMVKWLNDESDQTGLPGWHSDKEYACQCRRCRRLGFDPWVVTILWKRKWKHSPVFLPGKWTEAPGGLQSMGLQSCTGLRDWAHTHWSDNSHLSPSFHQRAHSTNRSIPNLSSWLWIPECLCTIYLAKWISRCIKCITKWSLGLLTLHSTQELQLKLKLLSRVWLIATSWTIAYQAPPSMGFSS